MLDPIVAIRYRLVLEPDCSATIDMVTGIGEDQDAALRIVEKYQDKRFVNRAFELARTHSQMVLQQINGNESDAQLYGRLAGAILFTNSGLRAEPNILAANRRGQSGLWGYSISGDLPIVLLLIKDPANMAIVRQMVQAHAYWRQKGLAVDLVIWNEEHGGYRQQLQDQILALVTAGVEANVVDRPGGIFIRSADQISGEDRILIQTGRARGHERCPRHARRSTGARRSTRTDPVTPSDPSRIAKNWRPTATAPRAGSDLLQRLRRIHPRRARIRHHHRPRPDHSRALGERDRQSAVRDRRLRERRGLHLERERPRVPSHALGATIRSATRAARPCTSATKRAGSSGPRPRCPTAGDRALRHPAWLRLQRLRAYANAGFSSEFWIYVAMDAPVKFCALKMRNDSGRTRRLSATAYMELVLGDLRSKSAMHVVTEADAETGAILARNLVQRRVRRKSRFFDLDDRARTFTGDRTEFIGRNGSSRIPPAMSRTALSGKVGAALDPCAALQLPFELADGQEREIVFRLGAGRDVDEANSLIRRFRGPAAARRALEAVCAFLGPDPGRRAGGNSRRRLSMYWPTAGFSTKCFPAGYGRAAATISPAAPSVSAISCRMSWRSSMRSRASFASSCFCAPPTSSARAMSSTGGIRPRAAACAPTAPTITCGCRSPPAAMSRAPETPECWTRSIPFLEGRPVKADEDSYYDLPRRSEEARTLYEHCAARDPARARASARTVCR